MSQSSKTAKVLNYNHETHTLSHLNLSVTSFRPTCLTWRNVFLFSRNSHVSTIYTGILDKII